MESSTIAAGPRIKNGPSVAGKKKDASVTISKVVFQVGRRCDQACPHCFFDSSPAALEKLRIQEILKAISDLRKTFTSVCTLIFTGGEPTLFGGLGEIIASAREKFPSVKIRLDTNGLNFFLNRSLFDFYRADIYDISIDPFHSAGQVADLAGKKIFFDFEGRSPLLELFMEEKELRGFDLNVRWTSDRHDAALIKKLTDNYPEIGKNLTVKPVTATGRGARLGKDVVGKGYTIAERPDNFSCLMGDSLLLAIDGYWYGCYHPVSLTRICRPGNPDFADKIGELMGSPVFKDLPKLGIEAVLRKAMKGAGREKKEKINGILKKKFWYRCQPCVEACDLNILKR